MALHILYWGILYVRENWRGPGKGQAILILTWGMVGYHAILLRKSSQMPQIAKGLTRSSFFPFFSDHVFRSTKKLGFSKKLS